VTGPHQPDEQDLDITARGPTSNRRIESRHAAPPQPAVPLPPIAPAPALSEAIPTPTPEAPRRSRRWLHPNILVTAATLVVAAAVAAWLVLRDEPVSLTVRNAPIDNPADVLTGGEAEMARLAELDGVKPHPDARCFFGPVVDTAPGEPSVVCGPVLLGIAGSNRPWLLGRGSYTPTGRNSVSGTFERFTDVIDADGSNLERPDGERPADPASVTPATDGIRTQEGRRVLELDSAIKDADSDLAALVETAGAASSDETRCYAPTMTDSIGRAVIGDRFWCGPILLRNSEPANEWISASISVQSTDSLVGSVINYRIGGMGSRTEELPANVTLVRPDSLEPPQPSSLEVPDAAPQESGYSTFLAELLAVDDVQLTAPDDGRLVLADAKYELTGLARVDQVGTGAAALVAARGENLVVAEIDVTSESGFSQSTATLVIDGRRLAFDTWTQVSRDGALVVSVPERGTDVDLEVLSEGRVQTISLVTGERAPGFPAAAYRSSPTVGVGAPISVGVPLPTGDPAQVTGVVIEARIDAYRTANGSTPGGWAPDESAFLSLRIEQWSQDPPCCDIADVKLRVGITLVLPDGTVVTAEPSEVGGSPAPLFVVPENITTGRIDVTVTADFSDPATSSPTSATATDSIELSIPE
jgi:hypothetical protein